MHVSGLQCAIRDRSGGAGGVVGYPSDRLHEEVAYLAYHFHWSRDDILAMEHLERQRWVQEVANINRRLNVDENA